jgi:hypothetical protein
MYMMLFSIRYSKPFRNTVQNKVHDGEIQT